MSSRWSRHRSVFVAIAALSPVASIAFADVLDPSFPRVAVVGAPRGAAPSERLDPQRTGRTTVKLPQSPVELWRRHAGGPLDFPPIIDASGGIYVALTQGDVIKLSPESKEQWRSRAGSSGALAAPALLADGTFVVINAAGQAVGLAPNGAVRFNVSLGVRGRDIDVAPLPLANGGLAIAAGSTLLEIDRDGVIRARTMLPERSSESAAPALERATGALVASPEGVVVTAESGAVYLFRSPGTPRKVGSLGGIPKRGGLLEGPRTLVAIVDNRRVVALDLMAGTTTVRSTAALSLYDGPPTLGRAPSGDVITLFASQGGTMIGVDALGNERVRVALEKPPPSADAGAPGPLVGPGGFGAFSVVLDLKPSPPLVVDPSGRVAFVRTGGRAGVVTPQGKVEVASERVCAQPIAVIPAGDKRLLIACKDGSLTMYGE